MAYKGGRSGAAKNELGHDNRVPALHDKSLAERENEINQIAGYSTSAVEVIVKLLAEENRWRMRASIVAGAALLINSLALLIMVIGGLL